MANINFGGYRSDDRSAPTPGLALASYLDPRRAAEPPRYRFPRRREQAEEIEADQLHGLLFRF
jgi:hypothetical protein